MVQSGRPSLHHRGLGHGARHACRPGLSILWSGATEIGTQHDIGLHGLLHRHDFSVVLLGLLVSVFIVGKERLHWRSYPFWPDEYLGRA